MPHNWRMTKGYIHTTEYLIGTRLESYSDRSDHVLCHMNCYYYATLTCVLGLCVCVPDTLPTDLSTYPKQERLNLALTFL